VPRLRHLALAYALAALVVPAAAAAGDYRIPPDNPFVGQAGFAPEIYSLGLRNPFRWSFDRQTGDLIIGDVGQEKKEEIDFVPPGGASGGNFGWPCREGNIVGPKPCTLANPISSVLTYDHPSAGAAVIGGYVVHDPNMPGFAGRYIYADFISGKFRSVRLATGSATEDRPEGAAALVNQPVAFGEDAAGGLYVVSMGGVVYKLSEDAGALKANPILNGLDAPMNVAGAPGDTSRLFIVERDGRVLLRRAGATTTFLDIRSQVSTGPGEEGMSSIAFAADYATGRRFYVFYTDSDAAIRIDEFRRSATDPNVADPSTQRHVLSIPHPDTDFHYGGQLQFGPDGYLYLATGDGGGNNDQFNNAQNPSVLLGKLLRIDVAPDAPPAPPAAGGDTRPPRFFTKTRRLQRVLRLGGVVVYARCPAEACTVSITARLRIGRLSYPLKRVRRGLPARKRVRLKARLTRRARRVLRKALHDGKRAKVDVAIRARDPAGNRTAVRRVTVRVRR
jgi:glucose/arabinose dehydrogenase